MEGVEGREKRRIIIDVESRVIEEGVTGWTEEEIDEGKGRSKYAAIKSITLISDCEGLNFPSLTSSSISA